LDEALHLLYGGDIEDVLQPWCGCDGSEQSPVLLLLGEGGPKLPSPLDIVRNSSTESSIMARRGVDAPLQVEPTKVVPSSPLLGERLRPPK
jgi:hypothetical protein